MVAHSGRLRPIAFVQLNDNLATMHLYNLRDGVRRYARPFFLKFNPSMFIAGGDHIAKPKRCLARVLSLGKINETPHSIAALARSAAALALRGHDGMTSGSVSYNVIAAFRLAVTSKRQIGEGCLKPGISESAFHIAKSSQASGPAACSHRSARVSRVSRSVIGLIP
jgi:hypothetical protein